MRETKRRCQGTKGVVMYSLALTRRRLVNVEPEIFCGSGETGSFSLSRATGTVVVLFFALASRARRN